MPSRILLVIKSSLYGSGRAAEGFRIATAMIAMDLLPQLLFIDDGVFCLLKSQAPEKIGVVSYTERLKALADLVGLFAVENSMKLRKLEQHDLDKAYDVKTISLDEAAKLIMENEVVMAF